MQSKQARGAQPVLTSAFLLLFAAQLTTYSTPSEERAGPTVSADGEISPEARSPMLDTLKACVEREPGACTALLTFHPRARRETEQASTK